MKGPKSLNTSPPVEWLWPRVEITPRGEVHPGHPQPLAFMKKRKHLFVSGSRFPPFWNCACRLIKLSLTGKTHSTQKINTRLFVIFFPPCAGVCVLMECLSPLWRKMMRSIILHSPGRYGFLFPRRIPAFCKNTDQEFTASCKGACMCGSCCHYSHIPTAETYE